MTPVAPGRAIVTRLDGVVAESVSWLWPARLARGKFTLVSGEPGIGKSFLTMDMTARISTGRAWPDGPAAPCGPVLVLSAEDGISDTIRPRVDLLGGDPSNVFILEAIREGHDTRRPASLVRDLDQLTRVVEEIRPLLVVIDPVTAYLGKTDTHRDAEVRSALAPVIALAERKQFALVAVGHLSKDAQRAALHRPGGSIGFVASARLVFAVAADPTDTERRILVPLKANIAAPAPALAYRVDAAGLSWESGPVSLDADTLLRAQPGDREDSIDAVGLVRELLADASAWPMDAKQAMDAAQAHGIHERSLRRAAKQLGIRIERSGFGRGGRWIWHRPIADSGGRTFSRGGPASPMAAMEKHERQPSNNNIEDKKSVQGTPSAACADDVDERCPSCGSTLCEDTLADCLKKQDAVFEDVDRLFGPLTNIRVTPLQ